MPEPYRLRGKVGGVERSFALRPDETSLGSAEGNDIVLSVRGVSKRHALVSLGPEGPVVEDLGSRNGLIVAGARLTRARLVPGSEIQLGPVTLRLERAEEAAASEPGPVAPMPPAVPGPGASTPASAVAAAMLGAGALVAQLVAGKATRDALFLSSFAVSALPVVMMASAAMAIAAVLASSRILGEHPPARVIPRLVAACAALFVLEWGASLVSPRVAAVAVYFHSAALGGVLLSGFWSMANERFDPYTAKRVLGRIGTGASLGGVLGGLLAFSAARVIRVPDMLLVLAGLDLVAWLALLRMRGPTPAPEPERVNFADGPPSALLGLRILGEVAYLRDLALIVGLGALSEALLDYCLKANAAASLPRGEPMMSFFALFYTGVGLMTLVVQSGLTRRSLEGLGLAGTVALLPATVTLTALSGTFAPSLLTAALARGSQAVVQGSFFRTSYELLFTALTKRRKRPTKTIVDVGFDKLGGLLGGGLVLLLVGVAPAASRHLLFALCAAAAAAALVLSGRIQRGYVAALEENLLSGAVRLDASDVTDSSTRLAIAQTGLVLDARELLRHPGAGGPAGIEAFVRDAAALASRNSVGVYSVLSRKQLLDPRLCALVIPLLEHEDLLPEALRVLRAIAPRTTGQLVDALLDAGQPLAVRRRLPRVLAACDSRRAIDGLLAGLGDASLEVRRACGLALGKATAGGAGVTIPEAAIFGAALRELEAAPAVAEDARTRERRLDHVFNLLSLVLEREPLKVSLWAVCSGDALRGTALEYLETVLPERVRLALWPLLGEPVEPRGVQRPRQQLVEELLGSRSLVVPERADADAD